MTPTNVEVPEVPIYEQIDGKPLFVKSYNQVVNGQSTVQESLPATPFQSITLSCILAFFYEHLTPKHHLAPHEPALQVDPATRLAVEIAVFESAVLHSQQLINADGFQVAPELAILMDCHVDLRQIRNPQNYFFQKIHKLLEFGVKEVIWLHSDTRKVTVARSFDKWEVIDWEKEIAVLEGNHSFSVAGLLAADGLL
ncbi:MAG: hypothetical protein AAGI38_05110 [Bacteroidota bacterium]